MATSPGRRHPRPWTRACRWRSSEAELRAGTLIAVCRSERTGVPKLSLAEGVLRAGHGLEGDAHAGAWHRQLSLLDVDDIAAMERLGLELAPGAFGENLVVEGVDLDVLGVGSRLDVGGAELRITQIGKACHDRCAIYETAGDCIMPRKGLFAEVVRGGRVVPGCPVRIVEFRARQQLEPATGACGEADQ